MVACCYHVRPGSDDGRPVVKGLPRREILTVDVGLRVREEELTVANASGDRLAATLCSPSTGVHEPVAAVLLCQGMSGVRRLVLPQVAATLAEAGIASLRFDYSGFGESEGERGWIDPAARVEDARSALSALLDHDVVDSMRVGIYGHSYGGPIALMLAVTDSRVRALAAVSSPGSGPDMLRAARSAWDWVALKHTVAQERTWIAGGGEPTVVPFEEILPFSPAFAAGYARLKADHGGTSAQAAGTGLGVDRFYLASVDRMLAARTDLLATELVDCPALFISGEDDDTAPVEALEPVVRAIRGVVTWKVIPGADHNALDADPGLSHALSSVATWFRSHL